MKPDLTPERLNAALEEMLLLSAMGKSVTDVALGLCADRPVLIAGLEIALRNGIAVANRGGILSGLFRRLYAATIQRAIRIAMTDTLLLVDAAYGDRVPVGRGE